MRGTLCHQHFIITTFSVIGIIIQWKFTGKGFDHTDGEYVMFYNVILGAIFQYFIVIIRRNENRIRTHLVRQPQEERRRQPGDQRQRRSRSRGRSNQQQRGSRPGTEFHRTRETAAPQISGQTQAATTQASQRNVSTDQNFDTLPPVSSKQIVIAA